MSGAAPAGYPQISVNLSNLALYVHVADLAFGGPAPALLLDRAFNMDSTQAGPFGTGWSFALGDSLKFNTDGSVTLSRASGRVDRFAASGSGFAAITATTDSLAQNSDGSYTLSSPNSRTTRQFNSAGLLAAILDGSATRVAVSYDAGGHITAAQYRGNPIQFSYDSAGHIKSISDAAGRTVGYSYSGNYLTGTSNADGTTATYGYDDSGNLTAIAYGGATFAISYNSDPPFNSVVAVTTPDGAARQYDTPNTPEQIRLTDGNGNAGFYVSNAQGLLESWTDANGNTATYVYDAAGRRTRAANGAGETSQFAYDSSGRLTSITDAAGDVWLAAYGAYGPARITDPNGNAWNFKYDGAGNLTSVANPASGTAAVKYTAGGQIAAIGDPAGNQTGYQYDANGLLTLFTDALGGQWSYQYDGAGRVSARTDPGGATLQAGYGAGTAFTSLASKTANLAVDWSGLKRDGLNRPTNYTDSFGNRIAYTYDAAGNLASMTLPGANKVTYQYDRANRLVAVSDWLGNFAAYRYDAAGYPVSMNASGGPVAIYQYDLARRLRAIVSTGPDGTPVAGYVYSYDAAGNRTGVSALEPLAAAPQITDFTATLNAEGEPVGRSDGQFFQYDARGYLSMVQGSRNIAAGYDSFGRLQSWKVDSAFSYTYDATGLRVVRTTDGTDRRFVHDFSGPRPRLVMEANADNSPVAWYVYGLGLLWKVAADGTTYFYHFDGDGNVVALSNPAQGVVNQYRYDAKGQLAGMSEAVDNPFHEHGEWGWMDDGNGLVLTGTAYRFPQFGLALPATADPGPPAPVAMPGFPGAGTCIVQGTAACSLAYSNPGRNR